MKPDICYIVTKASDDGTSDVGDRRMKSMKPDIWYIVTKASDDGTSDVGDRVRLQPDGSIIISRWPCGWIAAAQVEEATKGMEYVVDKKFIQAEIQACQAKLARLESMLDETSDCQDCLHYVSIRGGVCFISDGGHICNGLPCPDFKEQRRPTNE